MDSRQREPRPTDDLRKQNGETKQRLFETYGATFHQEEDLPPDIEADWLDDIEEFERRYADAKQTTVRAFTGNPVFTPIDQLRPEELPVAIQSVMDKLAEHGIAVDIVDPAEDDDIYRFLTEELPDVEIDDVRIDGMCYHFIYEEFHPNIECNAKRAAEELLNVFFNDADPMYMGVGLLTEGGHRMPAEEVQVLVRTLHAKCGPFNGCEQNLFDCTLDGDEATVIVSLTWMGDLGSDGSEEQRTATGTISLRGGEYGEFDVARCTIPEVMEYSEDGGLRLE